LGFVDWICIATLCIQLPLVHIDPQVKPAATRSGGITPKVARVMVATTANLLQSHFEILGTVEFWMGLS